MGFNSGFKGLIYSRSANQGFHFVLQSPARANIGYYVNPFKVYWLREAPTGLTFKNFTLCPHCIYVFCIYL